MGSREEENIISEANVAEYIDSTTDGGYWYKVKGEEPEFVAVTQKALDLFGYKTFDELKEYGATPHTVIHPVR